MIKTNKFQLSLVAFLTVICLCVGLGVYGAFLKKDVTGGGYQANNNDVSLMVNEGSIDINSGDALISWLQSGTAGTANLTGSFDFSRSTGSDLILREGYMIQGNGHTITLKSSAGYIGSGSYDKDVNYTGIFVSHNNGIIENVVFTTAADYEYETTNQHQHFGIIAGKNIGTINKCTLNMNNTLYAWSSNKWQEKSGLIWYDYKSSRIYCGGFTGHNDGTISNSTLNMGASGLIRATLNAQRQSDARARSGGFAATTNNGSFINLTANFDSAAKLKTDRSTANSGSGDDYAGAIIGDGYNSGNININGLVKNGSPILNSVSNTHQLANSIGGDRYKNVFLSEPLSYAASTIPRVVYDRAKYAITFNGNNLDLSLLQPLENGIVWSLGFGNNIVPVYNQFKANHVSIAKEVAGNQDPTTVDLIVNTGTVGSAFVGYASGSKVFDGNEIILNNANGLNLTDKSNPRNAGSYTISLIEDEPGLAKVDNDNRIVIPTVNVEYGITELTIDKLDIKINLTAMSGLIYNGFSQNGILTNITDIYGNSIQSILDKEALNMNWNGTDAAINADTHSAFIQSYNDKNYNITDSNYVEFVIEKRMVKPIWSDVINFKANGRLQLPQLTWDGAIEQDLATAFSLTSNGGINASNDAYTATASVNSNNYVLADGAVLSIEYYINFLEVTAISTNQYGIVTLEKSYYDYNEIAKLNVATKFGYAVTELILNSETVTDVETREFAIIEDTEFVLTFGARDVNVTINAENGTVTNDKEFKYNNEITLTAVPNEGYEFLNWTSRTGVILSNESTYTFVAIDNFEITANFVTVSENGVIYTFLSANGQLMKTIYAEEGSINLDEIQGTFLPGYTFKEWIAVSGKINTYIARYDIDATAEKMLVTVNGGKLMLDDVTEYTYNSVVTVIANEGAFKYWQDANGQILSYVREYKFSILENTEVTAVFDENAEIKNSVAVNGVKDNGDSWAFSASFASIEGYSVIEAGIMITSDANIATSENFVMGSKVLFAKSNKISKYNQYMITANKSVMNAGYARAYMIVNNGTENVIVYSDVIVSTASAN